MRAAVRAALGGALLLAACAPQSAPPPPSPVGFESAPATCSAVWQNDPRLDRPIVVAAIDDGLIDRAVRMLTNRARCEAGLSPLDSDPRLAGAARIHAVDMADAGVVAPTRPADPEKTLAVRYERAGVGPYRRRGENLMRISLETPGAARLASLAPDCDVSVAPGLVPTYRTVARRLVDAWLRTEAYSTNVLSPDWTHMGAAIAVRPEEGSCGDVYAAQSFKAF